VLERPDFAVPSKTKFNSLNHDKCFRFLASFRGISRLGPAIVTFAMIRACTYLWSNM